MKKKAIIKLIIYSVTALLLTAVMTVGILFDFGVFRYVTSNIIKYEENEENGFSPADSDTMTFTNVNSIYIEWTAGDVIIQKGSGDTVTVSESAGFEMNGNQKMRFSQNGDTLRIKFSRPILHWGSGTYNVWSKDLTVTLPEKIYDSVSVESVSADVEIYDLNAGELDIATVSGDVTLSGVDASELDCESVSGELDAENIHAKSVDCETVSGNMDYRGTISQRGSFNSVSGKIDLFLPPDADFAVEMNSFSGKKILNNGFADLSESGNKYINGSSGANISIESFSGDVSLNNLFSMHVYSSYSGIENSTI